MATEFMTRQEFEKRQRQKAVEIQELNPQHAEVNEQLSGRAQLLKSSENAVSYKNFNQNHIEETHLIKETYQRSIAADQSNRYESGATSSEQTMAPSMSKQVSLCDSHHTKINTLTESVNTGDYRETLNLDQEVYIQTKAESVPGELQQKINLFGGLSSSAMTRDVTMRNVKSQNYTERFQQLNTTGNIHLSGNGSLNAQKIYIGAPPPDSRIDYTLTRIAERYYPTVSGELFSKDLQLAPFHSANFIVTGKITVEGTLEAQKVASVNPLTFDETGLKLNLTQMINNYFGGMQIGNVGNIDFPVTPNIEVSYAEGKFKFDSSLRNSRVTISNKGYVEVNYQCPPQTSSSKNYWGWQLNITTQATLKAKFYPIRKPPETTSDKLENFARLFWQGMQEEYEIAKPYIPYVIPEAEGAVMVARTALKLPVILRLGPMVLSTVKGLSNAHN